MASASAPAPAYAPTPASSLSRAGIDPLLPSYAQWRHQPPYRPLEHAHTYSPSGRAPGLRTPYTPYGARAVTPYEPRTATPYTPFQERKPYTPSQPWQPWPQQQLQQRQQLQQYQQYQQQQQYQQYLQYQQQHGRQQQWRQQHGWQQQEQRTAHVRFPFHDIFRRIEEDLAKINADVAGGAAAASATAPATATTLAASAAKPTAVVSAEAMARIAAQNVQELLDAAELGRGPASNEAESKLPPQTVAADLRARAEMVAANADKVFRALERAPEKMSASARLEVKSMNELSESFQKLDNEYSAFVAMTSDADVDRRADMQRRHLDQKEALLEAQSHELDWCKDGDDDETIARKIASATQSAEVMALLKDRKKLDQLAGRTTEELWVELLTGGKFSTQETTAILYVVRHIQDVAEIDRRVAKAESEFERAKKSFDAARVVVAKGPDAASDLDLASASDLDSDGGNGGDAEGDFEGDDQEQEEEVEEVSEEILRARAAEAVRTAEILDWVNARKAEQVESSRSWWSGAKDIVSIMKSAAGRLRGRGDSSDEAGEADDGGEHQIHHQAPQFFQGSQEENEEEDDEDEEEDDDEEEDVAEDGDEEEEAKDRAERERTKQQAREQTRQAVRDLLGEKEVSAIVADVQQQQQQQQQRAESAEASVASPSSFFRSLSEKLPAVLTGLFVVAGSMALMTGIAVGMPLLAGAVAPAMFGGALTSASAVLSAEALGMFGAAMGVVGHVGGGVATTLVRDGLNSVAAATVQVLVDRVGRLVANRTSGGARAEGDINSLDTRLLEAKTMRDLLPRWLQALLPESMRDMTALDAITRMSAIVAGSLAIALSGAGAGMMGVQLVTLLLANLGTATQAQIAPILSHLAQKGVVLGLGVGLRATQLTASLAWMITTGAVRQMVGSAAPTSSSVSAEAKAELDAAKHRARFYREDGTTPKTTMEILIDDIYGLGDALAPVELPEWLARLASVGAQVMFTNAFVNDQNGLELMLHTIGQTVGVGSGLVRGMTSLNERAQSAFVNLLGIGSGLGSSSVSGAQHHVPASARTESGWLIGEILNRAMGNRAHSQAEIRRMGDDRRARVFAAFGKSGREVLDEIVNGVGAPQSQQSQQSSFDQDVLQSDAMRDEERASFGAEWKQHLETVTGGNQDLIQMIERNIVMDDGRRPKQAPEVVLALIESDENRALMQSALKDAQSRWDRTESRIRDRLRADSALLASVQEDVDVRMAERGSTGAEVEAEVHAAIVDHAKVASARTQEEQTRRSQLIERYFAHVTKQRSAAEGRRADFSRLDADAQVEAILRAQARAGAGDIAAGRVFSKVVNLIIAASAHAATAHAVRVLASGPEGIRKSYVELAAAAENGASAALVVSTAAVGAKAMNLDRAETAGLGELLKDGEADQHLRLVVEKSQFEQSAAEFLAPIQAEVNRGGDADAQSRLESAQAAIAESRRVVDGNIAKSATSAGVQRHAALFGKIEKVDYTLLMRGVSSMAAVQQEVRDSKMLPANTTYMFGESVLAFDSGAAKATIRDLLNSQTMRHQRLGGAGGAGGAGAAGGVGDKAVPLAMGLQAGADYGAAYRADTVLAALSAAGSAQEVKSMRDIRDMSTFFEYFAPKDGGRAALAASMALQLSQGMQLNEEMGRLGARSDLGDELAIFRGLMTRDLSQVSEDDLDRINEYADMLNAFAANSDHFSGPGAIRGAINGAEYLASGATSVLGSLAGFLGNIDGLEDAFSAGYGGPSGGSAPG